MGSKVDTYEFESPINLEGSWGGRRLRDKAKSTMDLFLFEEDLERGFIEWDIPELEMTEGIGLWFDVDKNGKRTLRDYDGVMSLPKEAVTLMERNGIICGEDFKDDE